MKFKLNNRNSPAKYYKNQFSHLQFPLTIDNNISVGPIQSNGHRNIISTFFLHSNLQNCTDSKRVSSLDKLLWESKTKAITKIFIKLRQLDRTICKNILTQICNSSGYCIHRETRIVQLWPLLEQILAQGTARNFKSQQEKNV